MSGDFSRRTESLLDRAEAVCEHRGAKLTELRRHVLGMILNAASPTGAYDLLDKLRQTRRGAAPPTVYRTLDFLLEQGLIHRVERLSAFVGCVAGCTADHAEGENPHPRRAVPDLPSVRPRDRDAGPRCLGCAGARGQGGGLQHQRRDNRGRGPVQHLPRCRRRPFRGSLMPNLSDHDLSRRCPARSPSSFPRKREPRRALQFTVCLGSRVRGNDARVRLPQSVGVNRIWYERV